MINSDFLKQEVDDDTTPTGYKPQVTFSYEKREKKQGSAKLNFLFSPGQMIRPVVESIKLGPFDIPQIFFRRITDAKIILTFTPGWPLETNIQTLQVHPRKLQINPTVN